MTRITALLALLALTACGKKDSPASSGGESTKAASAASANIPSDKNSQEFASYLIDHPVHSFKPVDNAGAPFVYVTLSFRADNTWIASSRMGDGEETIECKEEGGWSMEPADSPTIAMMTWHMTKSTCPGRPRETIMRTRVVIEGSDYRIYFR